MRPASICLLALLAACSVRQLEHMQRWHGAADIEMEARGIRRDQPDTTTRDTADAGLSVRAQGGPGRLGFALGLDVHAGAGTHGGFAYDAAFRPLGAGLDLGGLGALAVTAGIGTAGITGQEPTRLRLPLELRLEVDLHPRMHVRVFGDVDGHHRDRHAGFALRLGKGGQRYNERWGNGAYLGVLVGDHDHDHSIGLVLGYGITDRYVPDLAEPRGL
ncbi:MAG TPA: hypothetical protein VL172_11125 [Kofleriaceae bacterium]|nr:hypothetical protein [Kofleriaceae bacterium]